MIKIRSITNSLISLRLRFHPRTVGSFWGYARAKVNKEHIGFKLFFQAARLCLGKGQSQTSCQSTSIQCGVPPRWRDYRKQQKRHIGSSLGTTRGISRGEVWQKYQKRLCQDWQESRQQIVCAGTFLLAGVSPVLLPWSCRIFFWFAAPSSKTVTNPCIHNSCCVQQVALRWIVQSGGSFTTQSKNKDHFSEDLNIFDFELTDEEMKTLNALA